MRKLGDALLYALCFIVFWTLAGAFFVIDLFPRRR